MIAHVAKEEFGQYIVILRDERSQVVATARRESYDVGQKCVLKSWSVDIPGESLAADPAVISYLVALVANKRLDCLHAHCDHSRHIATIAGLGTALFLSSIGHYFQWKTLQIATSGQLKEP